MEYREILEGLSQIQEIARRLREGTNITTLDRTMRTVETYCYMMQWQLGGTDDPMPEVDAGG